MAKVRTDRLLKLADFLETVPRKNFALSLWVSNNPSKPEGKKQGECGFAGCAVGWAAHAKLYQGFRAPAAGDNISYRGETGFRAVDKLFGLVPGPDAFSSDAGKYLFSGRNYPGGDATPKQVARRIRKFVKDQAASPK